MKKKGIRKALYIAVGILNVGLGALGAALPVLPAFPFLVIAAFCLAKGSPTLYGKFKNSKLYKNNLESFLRGKGMTKRAKARVILTVTLTMGVSFYLLFRSKHYILCGVLGVVWLGHLLYFLFWVRTI